MSKSVWIYTHVYSVTKSIQSIYQHMEKNIEMLKKGLIIDKHAIKSLTVTAIDILAMEDQVLMIDPPVSICGDIHGQFYDLIELFKAGGDVPETKYLFLGDLVDRGFYSVETLLLLLSLKVKYPSRIYLIRGNYESWELTLKYGFYQECYQKYRNSNVWSYCTDVFDSLSISAVIGNIFVCTVVYHLLSPVWMT